MSDKKLSIKIVKILVVFVAVTEFLEISELNNILAENGQNHDNYHAEF